jgi:Acetyl-CoA dehydrogenase C-terminal like/Acyl-CoA dehydrogenase, C-terminal domain
MLLDMKARVEGLRALAVKLTMHIDRATAIEKTSGDKEAAEYHIGQVDLLVPLLKAYGSDQAFQICATAIQVYGGAGFLQDWPVEQYCRDSKIFSIYEGTNHIQAMDLVGRKLPRENGRAVRAFLQLVASDVAEAKAAGDPSGVGAALDAPLADLQAATMWLAQNGMADPNQAGAGAYPYMNLMGLVALGWMWLKMAAASSRALAAGDGDKPFHEAKLATAAFYAARELPRSAGLRHEIEAGAETLMKLPEEAF